MTGRADTGRTGGDARLAGLLAGIGAYVAAWALDLPRPFYLPLADAWTFARPQGAIRMGYYGLILWGLAGFLAGWAAAHLPPLARALDRDRVRAALARAVLAALLAGVCAIAVAEFRHWVGGS